MMVLKLMSRKIEIHKPLSKPKKRLVVVLGTYFERIKIPNEVTLRAGNDEKGKIGFFARNS